jgi:hypothetical protein|eukprot:SAG25_NODE_1562_length_2763_cov_1.521772_1_plen_65_part_00
MISRVSHLQFRQCLSYPVRKVGRGTTRALAAAAATAAALGRVAEVAVLREALGALRHKPSTLLM